MTSLTGHIDDLPAPVRRIAEEARRFHSTAEARAATRRIWDREAAADGRIAPDVSVEDGGETVRLGDLSPGCVACKSGTWDCVFVTMRCNLSCGFCLRSDGAYSPAPRGVFGEDLAASIAGYKAAGVTGVSFSGGEPFLEPDVVLRWVRALRAEMPGVYLWAYTNGCLLTGELLRRLAEMGLDELRFDLAATGYCDEAVLAAVREAARLLPTATVEVPAIPADRGALLGSLETWADLGVRYLNLHELVYEPGSASARMPGERSARTMPDGHRCEVDPGSAGLMREVVARAADASLPMAVNGCSLRSKVRQLRGRRSALARFTLRPHETPSGEALAESALVFGSGTVIEVPSAEWRSELASRGPGWRAARVVRLLPLDVSAAGQWVGFELLGQDLATEGPPGDGEGER